MLVIMIGIGGWIMGGIEEKTGIIVVDCLYKGTGHPSPDRNGYPATGCGRARGFGVGKPGVRSMSG
jgi:hypothetical protein